LLLPDHNAHLTKIESEAVAADAELGIAAAPPALRWSGDSWTHLEDEVREVIRGGQQVTIAETRIRLPQNLPVQPVSTDQLTFTMLRTGATLVLKVREVNDRFALLGFMTLIGRVA
jgi:hypothetical protein